MKYGMTKPCATCPFRKDGAGVKLMPARIREIARSTGWNGASFACHSSLDYDKLQEEGGESEKKFSLMQLNNDPKAQHCGGATIFGLKNGGPNQMLRIVDRLGGVDLGEAHKNSHLVYDNLAEWLKKGALPARSRKKGLG